jgi:2-methylcitrate dehydratase PrpD
MASSELLARFVAEAHSGTEFQDAVRAATAMLELARDVQPPEGDGSPLGRAFATAIALSDTEATPADAAIVAAALTSSAVVKARDDAGVLEAIAVGREVAARLASALTLDPAWDTAAVVAGIGAAAAAARAAGLDAAATRHAIGLAATQATGLGVVNGTHAALLASGKTAADALESAFLARNGFTSAPAALEGRRGLAALMASHLDEAVLTDELGHRWVSLD